MLSAAAARRISKECRFVFGSMDDAFLPRKTPFPPTGKLARGLSSRLLFREVTESGRDTERERERETIARAGWTAMVNEAIDPRA